MNHSDSHNKWIELAHEKQASVLALLISEMSTNSRNTLLAAIKYQMNQSQLVAVERTRVALTRLLVALVPESWSVIRSLIQQRKGNRLSEEVRFSLFCTLDDLPGLAGGAEYSSDAACLVGDYLRCAKSRVAQAAWMAGDLLGDHWDPHEGVPILIDVLKNGKYAEGRLAALHGLEQAMGHPHSQSRNIGDIRQVISFVANDDRSSRVRAVAMRICDDA